MISAQKVAVAGRDLGWNLDDAWVANGFTLGRAYSAWYPGAALPHFKPAETYSSSARAAGFGRESDFKDVPLYLDEIGTCAAYESVNVQSQVSGQIVARHFTDGQDVKKGDLLFTIDPRPYKRPSIRQKPTYAGAGKLGATRGTASQGRDRQAGSGYRESQRNARPGHGGCGAGESRFHTIRSPIDGRIGLRQVDVGKPFRPARSSAVLVTIDNLDPIYTDFTIAEPDIPDTQVSRWIECKRPDETAEHSRSGASGQTLLHRQHRDAWHRTVQARGVTPNPDRLFWPSEFVNVRLVLDILKNAMLVPNDAVQVGQNGPYVFVVKSDMTLDLRQVTPGQRQEGDLTVITKGLKPGETVVTAGQLQLAPGTKVVVKSSNNNPTKKADVDESNQVP